MAKLGGYTGKILRVDLTEERITEEALPEATLRKFLGGTGLGVKIMYDEVPAGVEWSDPENRLIWLTGPLSGTRAPASGLYTVATKGPLTNLFVASHCNGFFGARLRFAGYDAIIVQGAAKRWVYLYVHDGTAELRDATHLLGKNAWETQELLPKEVGEPKASVSCIGPAGENLVKYACIGSDRGHVASTNGCGAVMGSKKLKAIVAHGKAAVPIHDKTRFNALVKQWWEESDMTIWAMLIPTLGTNGQISACYSLGQLPIKNLSEFEWPDHERFNGDALREYYQGKPRPCYACRFAHCHEIELKSGPHKGAKVEEAEYEGTNAFSSQIGNTDIDAAEWLNNVNDRLGMDLKEQAWVLGMAMECYNKGIISKKDTDGIDLTWGNVEGVEALINKIARRDGLGDVLAEGVMRAAFKIGGDAPKFAVYTHKGNGPHVMDPRAIWSISFGMAISDMGSGPAADMGDLGDLTAPLGEDVNVIDPEKAFEDEFVAKSQALMARRGHFIDCLGICMFVSGVPWTTVAQTVSAVTGWDLTWREAATAGERILNMMRAFNIRHGFTREHNSCSPRILETPAGGPVQGISVAPKWDEMVSTYYEALEWDQEGKPRPETLARLGLESVAQDLAS